MRLSALLEDTGAALPMGSADPDVCALAVDSRRVGRGALFAALPGEAADGAEFASAAVAAGAAAVLAGRPLALPVPVAVSPQPRRSFALAAARFHGDPSRRFGLFGITGTNGKTTTAYLVEQLSALRGQRTGLIGTVEVRLPSGTLPSTHTTPESHELQELLARMAASSAQVVAMEVSSHALAQERATGCTFAGAAFTNLTRDHLDYHGTMDAYYAAKARLFRELLPRGAPAVLNLDDPACARLAAELRSAGARVVGFSARGAPEAALVARGAASDLRGVRFTAVARAPLPVGEAQVESPLVGAHNIENLLAALGLLAGTGVALGELAALAPGAPGAPGRLERVADPAGRLVFVDYAHTDDALARVLDALRSAMAKGPRLIAVFGCGGDRDRGKRPLMGEAAARRADLAVATSDNPRTEDPLSILADVEPGLRRAGGQRLDAARAAEGGQGYVVVPDRREAIALAVRAARPGDVVLIAGKGHEDYQLVGREKKPFDDRVEARAALAHLAGLAS